MPDNRPAMPGRRVTVKEAAALAEVSCQTVHNWIAQGRVQPLQTDDGARLDLEELGRFLAMRRAASAVGIQIDTLLHWTDEAGATT